MAIEKEEHGVISNEDPSDDNPTSEDESTNDKKRKLPPKSKDEPVGKKKRKSLKPPTAEELSDLQETEQLFKSQLRKLQIDELLKVIGIKEKYRKQFEAWFTKVKEILQAFPQSKSVRLSSGSIIKIVRPESCTAFNMHKIFSSDGPELIVDVNITMPKSCFQEKDYLDQRYTKKCKQYLKYMCKKLKQENLIGDSLLSDYSKSLSPSIKLKLPASEKVHVTIFVTPSEDTFKLARFEPDISNLRECHSFKGLDIDKIRESGTPFYNSVLLYELTMASNCEYLERCMENFENVKDAVKLLQLWQQKRGLHLNGFTNHILIHIIVYLILQKKIFIEMSSYNVIKNFWIFLSKSNWHKKPISMCENVNAEKLNKFRRYFDVVFLDKSGSYNLTCFLSLDVYMKVRNEAELAVRFLDDDQMDSFMALFKVNLYPQVQYDALLRLNRIPCDDIFNTIEDDLKYKYVGCLQQLMITHISNLLKKGLSKRLLHIVPIQCTDFQSVEFSNQIVYGLTLDPAHAFSVLEKGPPSNSHEALDFRKFWEDLAECRRFMDGSICEAVYFPADTFHGKRKVFKKIIDFVVKRKLKIERYSIVSNAFEETLLSKNVSSQFSAGTCEEATLYIITAFDELSKIIRELKLQLPITSIQGGSEIFCYTNPFPPHPTNYKCGGKMTTSIGENIILKTGKLATIPRYVEYVKCVIQLADSSKWPNDLKAITLLKTAFNLEISKMLKENNQIVSSVKSNCLDVLYQGLVFRFVLYVTKEVYALKRSTTPNGEIVFKENAESAKIETACDVLPKIIGALNGIQSQNHTFGTSTCLIKRWLRSQLIDEYHISDIAISLINAHLYLKPAPYNSSNLPQVAFLRFLQFMTDYDWNLQFITVNFNNEISKETLGEIDADFQVNRQKYPFMFIVTPFDSLKSLFSKSCTREILQRISQLAFTTFQYINQEGNNVLENVNLIKNLFIPNLEGYNVLIHIKPPMNAKRYQRIELTQDSETSTKIEKFNNNEKSKIPIIGFNPVESYVLELREHYGDVALFFHDPYGGNVVAVLWNPLIQDDCFKESYAGKKVFKNNKLILNKESVIEDFYLLGNGIVKEIEVKS